MKCLPDCPMTNPALGDYACNRQAGLYHGYCHGAPVSFDAGIEHAEAKLAFWALVKQASEECMARYIAEHGLPRCECGAVVGRINRIGSGLPYWRCPECGAEYDYQTPWGKAEEGKA